MDPEPSHDADEDNLLALLTFSQEHLVPPHLSLFLWRKGKENTKRLRTVLKVSIKHRLEFKKRRGTHEKSCWVFLVAGLAANVGCSSEKSAWGMNFLSPNWPQLVLEAALTFC